MMMLVLPLLVSCFYLGLSYETDETYGSTFRMRLPRTAQSIDFTPLYSAEKRIVWRSDEPEGAREEGRGKVIGSYFVLSNLTQEDSGDYVMRDKTQRRLHLRSINVIASQRSMVRRTGESLNLTSGLDPSSCNIYFVPEHDHDQRETEIVVRGRLQEDTGESGCSGFQLLKPCGIVNEGLQSSCSGHFEVRDAKGNKAFELNLVVKYSLDKSSGLMPDKFDASKIGIGIGVFFAVISCCTCMRRCCCGESSSDKDSPETPDAEPAAQYQEYENEPGVRRPEPPSTPSRTPYPAQPYYAPTVPLIHNPPPVPPAYSEVSAPAAPAAPAVRIDSEPEPRFELKGMSFPSAPPLSSEPTCSDVYTSDKLNFL